MPVVVQKYGGSSVASLEKVRRVALRVAARRETGVELVVVVSAMGDTTDELLALAKGISADPPRRELDMLLSAGERISMALLSMALQEAGVPAISFTGSQSGILTDEAHSNARIVEVRPARIQEALARGQVVIVAGYQGVSRGREVTTLGRGGSDTTAVALAAALSATACEIYSDVDGVHSADPRLVLSAHRLDQLGYLEMQELARSGAKVLNAQAVEWARRHGIAIQVLHASGEGCGTRIGPDAPREGGGAVGVALLSGLVLLRLRGQEALELALDALSRAGASPHEVLGGGDETSLWLSLEDLHGIGSLAQGLARRLGERFQLEQGLCAVSAVGHGLSDRPETLRRALAAFEAPVLGVASRGNRLSLYTFADRGEAALGRLHAALVAPAVVHSIGAAQHG